MAELIDKDELIQIIDTASDNLSERLKAVFIDIVAELPTTTESEIRASAQREIVEWCFDNKVDFAILERYADKEKVVDCVLKHFTAEQLKEE